jgi:hypothetical protein
VRSKSILAPKTQLITTLLCLLFDPPRPFLPPVASNPTHSSAQSLAMSGKKTPTKGATVVEEKKKLLQQYKDDDGHFSLVR